jgi:pyridoxamine 5'-phosphate oxidase
MTFLEKLRCLLTFGQGVALPMPELKANQEPLTIFENWFYDATRSGVLLPESMSVSTCSADGQPSSRMVLLKHYNKEGFVFYTNYGSRKTQEITENNKVALLFHWGVLQRQVRIEGIVEKVSQEQSEDYFHSRDRGSQIGAWASHQSEKITNDTELEQRVKMFEQKFAGKQIPLPDFWGGWRVKPHYYEFWQGRASRLHDRLCFEKQENGSWANFKLMP